MLCCELGVVLGVCCVLCLVVSCVVCCVFCVVCCVLTNACAVISFEVAQYFPERKTFPSDTVLAELIEKSASKMRYIRGQLKMVLDKYEEIDLD